MGKFNKENVNPFLELNIFDLFGNFIVIPIEKVVKIFKKQDINLDKSLYMTQFLNSFHTITNSNNKIIDLYNELIQSFVSILTYNNFIKEKEKLLNQHKIIENVYNRNDMAEIFPKLKEIKDSIIINKRKLIYLEEDYFKEKNREDQFKKSINGLKIKIENSDRQKRENISQINKLIREMDDPTLKNTNKENNLSYSEKILALQKGVKECQYEIKTTGEKLNSIRNEFDNFVFRFEKLEKDHQKLLNILSKDHNKMKEIKTEIGEKLRENLDDFDELYLIKSLEQIDVELQEIENKMNSINELNQFLNKDQPKDLTKIQEKIMLLQNLIIKNQEVKTPVKENEIIETIENFRKIENKINSLEELVNKFLIQIYLKSRIEITISEDNMNLFLQLSFFHIRKKSILNFDELTTPEKIFFVIVLYISIKILLNSKNIIFSNLFLPSFYNKRGSIFRTIKNIIPVFGREDVLKGFNLIFLVTNLEMREQIKNLKVITI